MSGLQEKLITNWLDSTGERAYQAPFCAMLVAEGHTVLHSTRHCAMELGKDVITFDPDGTPCAYQLKSSSSMKHGVGEWRKELHHQIQDLVSLPIKHPGVDAKHGWHHSYFVTNREIEEELWRVIHDFNEGQESAGYPQRTVTVISRGDLLKRFLEQGEVWPSELAELKSLLEFMTCDGRSRLDRGKLASLLESTFDVSDEGTTKPKSTAEAIRLLASASLLYAHALQPWMDEGNHVALIYGWQVFCVYILAVAEEWQLPKSKWIPIHENAMGACMQALDDLADEVRDSDLTTKEDIHLDKPFDFYRYRVTEIMGLMAARCYLVDDERLQGAAKDFLAVVRGHFGGLLFWGEAAFPFFISTAFTLERLLMKTESMVLVACCASNLIRDNQRSSNQPLATVYRLDEWVMEQVHGLDDLAQEQFAGMAWTCESLIYYLARRDQKEILKKLWPKYAKILAMSYTPPDPLSFHRWRSRKGKRVQAFPKPRKEWAELKDEANNVNMKAIPKFYHDKPGALLMFVLTYPHRYTSNISCFLDKSLPRLVEEKSE